MYDLTKLHIYFLLGMSITVSASSITSTKSLDCGTQQPLIQAVNAAMNGFDPMVSDTFTFPNPGYKNKIFKPFAVSQKINVLNSFIEKADTTLYCSIVLKEKPIRNYYSYKSLRQSDITFSEESTKSAGFDETFNVGINFHIFNLGATKRINFLYESGYGRKNSDHEEAIKEFFKETMGEMIEYNTECITHTVAISSYIKPVLTDSFTAALR